MEGQESLIKLVQSLSEAIVYSESSNFDTNKKLWNQYAIDWSKDADYVKKMVGNLPGQLSPETHLQFIGDEWSDPASLDQVFVDFFIPNLDPEGTVAEIGSGGGRIASRVVGHVKKLYCFDVAQEMLNKAKLALKDNQDKVQFILLTQPKLPDSLFQMLDFVICFDVLVHVDLHTMWQYFCQIKKVLRPGGRALIHTANLTTDQGWARFEAQSKYSVAGFYFISPEILHTLIERVGGLKIIKKSDSNDTRSTYYCRDYLVLLEKI